MPIREITLAKQTKSFTALPVINWCQGETLKFRLPDSGDLNGATLKFSLREGLANPNQSLATATELVQNPVRSLTVAGSPGFADWFINYNETKNWGTGNKTYTLEVKIQLANGTIFEWGKYEARISENLVGNLPSNVNLANYFTAGNPREFWLSPRDTSTLTLSGSDITQINDKSGNTKNFVSSTGQELALNNAGINGVPCMQSDGILDVLTFPTIDLTVFTLYLVVSPTGDAKKIFEALNAYYLFGTTGSTSEVIKATNSGRNYTTNWATIAPTFKIIKITYGGTNATHTMSINGGANVLTGTGAEIGSGSKTSGQVSLARMAGLYGDVLLFGRVLSTSEDLEITNELKSIYSIT